MRVSPYSFINGDENRTIVPGGGNNHLVRRITVKRLRQLTTLDKNRAGEFPQVQARDGSRVIEPLVERTIQRELAFLDLLRNFPQRDQRQPEIILTLRRHDSRSGSSGQPVVIR